MAEFDQDHSSSIEENNQNSADFDRSQRAKPPSTQNRKDSLVSVNEKQSVESLTNSRVQTLFEFDPTKNEISWSDLGVAAYLTGKPDISPSVKLSDYNNLIVNAHSDERECVFAGKANSYHCEYQILQNDESFHWVEERGGWIGSGASRRLIGMIRSVEDEKSKVRELSWLARNDELTGLLNRVSLRHHLDEWFESNPSTGQKGAYLLVGVDHLAAVNADFGFEVADEVIVEVAARLRVQIGPENYMGRVAGTKFGILLHECPEACVRAMAAKILNSVRERVIDTAKGGIAASVSLGAVALPEFANTSQEAMSCAESALDEAKRIGRSSWTVFSQNTDNISMRRRNTHLSDVILTALNERRIQIAFQPIVTDPDQVPSKFECLIRMKGQDGEEIPAPEFIPAAERLGLVHLLDRRVLEMAINTLVNCPNINLAVNISMETVKDYVWAERYIALIRENQNVASRITVELTETQVVDAVDASIEFVSSIKKLGCDFAIDDFGAGYTSFRILKALDIDVLKIDGSFVTGVASSRDNQLFVRTLLDLARNFGMKTVAEWVDNDADAMLLKGLGVDYLQGYLIGKPQVLPSWLPEGAPNVPPANSLRD